MAMVYKGYYNMVVERRRDAHELWTGVLVECLSDLEQVAEAAPEGLATDLQFGRLRKHYGQYVKAAGALFTVGAMIMAEKRGQQARGVWAETFAGSRRAKDDGPVGEDIRTALGTWPLEEGQPVDYRKRVLDSDDEEEMRVLPEEEQRLARRTKVLRRYVPTQAVVKRPAVVEESNVAMRAWLGVSEGAATAPEVGKSKRGLVRGKGAPEVTSGSKKKGVKRSGQGFLAGWVVRTPKDEVGAQGKREEWDPRDASSPGWPEGEEIRSERDRRGVQATQASMEVTWGTGDVGPVQPGYESGDTDAMLNAFNRDTHRALADWVGDSELWPGWFGQGLHAMPPNPRGYQAYEADRTRWVLEQPGGAERQEAATARRLQRHADPDGARRQAREPVVTASDLIRDRAERRQLDQAIAEGGRGRRPRVAFRAAASQSTTSQPASQREAPVLLQRLEVSDQGQEEVVESRGWGAEGVQAGAGAARRKRKPGSRAVARQRKKQRAQQAMMKDSPERPASRPSDEEMGQVPPVVYEPEDPMDVG